MKFTRLILDNYIGIYNGMGLNHIDINLGLCRHRMLIIRGENGSGKSTIFNAMTVLPDSNEMFIPDQPASKIIELQDGPVLYKMIFNHPIKSSGGRDTTKAYLYKTINGQTINMNPNGNVSSYKEILYDELGLDPNFIALSQLSTEDKGLASKKPAERKRFVNAIMSSLEVYNSIYKSLIKKSTATKSLINTITTRLGTIGDPSVLNANLSSIENQINNYNDRKDQATKDLMKYTAQKELLDPDGSIQTRHSTLSSKVAAATKKLYGIYDKLKITVIDPISTLEDYQGRLEDIDRLLKATIDNITRMGKEYSDCMETILSLKKQAEQKRQAIEGLSDEESFEDICDKLAISEAILENYRAQLAVTGVNPGSITKEEYIMALTTLRDIKESVDAFRRSCSSNDTMMEIIALAKEMDKIPLKDPSSYDAKVDAYIINAPKLNEFIISCDRDIEKLKQLDNRPTGCIDDTCPFISDLIRIRDNDVVGQRAAAARELNGLEICYEDAKLQLARIKDFNINAINLNNLVRLVTINGAILTRLPHGRIYTDKISFIEALIANEDFSYVDEIFRYIDIANIFDEYNAEMTAYNDLARKRDLYLSKSDVIGQLNSELNDILQKLSDYTAKSEKLQSDIEGAKKDKDSTDLDYMIMQNIVQQLTTAVACYNEIMASREEMNSLFQQMATISNCDELIKQASEKIAGYTKLLAPLFNERDKVKHSIEMIEDYNRELATIQEQYNLIELIKYYSSPTSGIQLVFMELYMGKIIGLANELLSLLFNGKFVIQPFIINESEFRIPCLGDGYLNDDISSMSSAQISMISMIIGFALLHNSSTKYNVIKLDEIDGPLDENNRILFTELLNKIMDIMHTEQCVLISHNSELNVDDSDLIILKSDNLSVDYARGNIIWKY